MATTGHPAAPLSRRLRQLRETGLDGVRLTQRQLAAALGVSVPLISSWENERERPLPSVDRIGAISTLFCTGRSFADGRLRQLREGDLTGEEVSRRADLEQELLALHPARTGWTGSSATLGGLYEFPPGQDVTIVCAPVPQELLDAMPYANPDDPDHIELYRYADLDALFELQGHVRAANPASRVVAHLSTELTRDDYTAHLVVLGGVDWNELTRLLLQEEVRTSVQQIPSAQDPQGSGFLVVDQGGSCTFRPRLRGGRLVEDVAYVLRAPNPYNHLMTLTMCNGIYGRGTYGAVRALTDTRFRDQNEQYLRQRFPGASTFGLLTRVHIVGGKAVTPDWTQADMRLHEWSVE